MASLDLTSFDFSLKEYYTNDKIKMMVYKNNPLLALLPKMTSFLGDQLPVPVIYSNPQGRSAVFSTAQTNKTATSGIKFVLTRARDYCLASIDNETLEASASDKGAFMSAVTTEVDGSIHSLKRSLATALYRDGSGVLGRISSAEASFADTTITLANIEDAVNFEKGMVLVSSAQSDGTSIRSGTVTLSGVNRLTGVLTASANWSAGISEIAASDYLYVQGDAAAKVKGLNAWMPTSVTSTSFFGVNRTADSTRLGGNYYDGSSDPIEEALITIGQYVAREGGEPDYCFMNHIQYGNLEKALGSRVHYVDVKGPVGVGFKAMELHTNGGTLKVIADHNCPHEYAYLLQMDTWKLYSLGECPKIIQTDGNKFLRDTSADSIELRVGYYAQLGCSAPGWNGRVKLASSTAT